MGDLGKNPKCPECGKHQIRTDVIGSGLHYCTVCGWMERPGDDPFDDPYAHEEGKSGG